MESLSHLKIREDDEGVAKLTSWETVSHHWSAQPTIEAIHVFVKLPAAGKSNLLFPPMRSADIDSPFYYLQLAPQLQLLQAEQTEPSNLVSAVSLHSLQVLMTSSLLLPLAHVCLLRSPTLLFFSLALLCCPFYLREPARLLISITNDLVEHKRKRGPASTSVASPSKSDPFTLLR